MTIRRLLIGSNNPGKHTEIGEALAGLSLELIKPSDIDIQTDPDENGSSFAENAIMKARHFRLASDGLPTLADDSGIIVEALKNELGISTRRWGAGPKATDDQWIDFFLRRMEKEKNKRARFVCCIAYIDAQGKEYTFEGTCDGVITQSLEAGYLPGLPISACFKPKGFDCVYSAMSIEQKNSTSHRGRALKKLRMQLLKTS